MIFQPSLGLYIGSDRASAALLGKGPGGPKLVAHSDLSLDPKAPFAERVQKAFSLLAGFALGHKAGGARLHVGFQSDLAIFRYLTVPLALKENLRGSLGYEMDKYIPLGGDEVFFDYQIIAERKNEGTLDLLLAVTKRAVINRILEAARSADWRLDSIEPGASSLANAVFCLTDGHEYGCAALVYVDNAWLELAAVDAWSLKYGTMLERPEGEKDDSGLLLQALTQIQEYWGLDEKDCSVLVFGPGAGPDFLDKLKTGEAPVGKPAWTRPLGRDEGSIFSYGLAVKEFKEVPVRLNVLPLGLRRKPSRTSRYVMITLCALLVVSGTAWWGGGIVKNRAMAEKIDVEMSRLGDEIARVEKNRQQCRELVQQIEILQGIKGHSPRTLDIMKELTERIPKDAWLSEMRIAEDSVIISGNAETATQLIPLLEDSPLFGDVAFLSPVSKTREGKERFRIRLNLIV